MDTITHALIGMGIAETGFRKKIGGSAILGGAILGALPDIDLLSYWWGEGLRYHRAETHSLLLSAVAAPLIGWMIAALTHRKETFPQWSLLTLLCLWAHSILDLLTSWGTEIFAPFDRTRYALDALSLIDPFFSLPLLIAGVLCLLSRRKLSRAAAACSLGWCAAYAGFGAYNNHKACELAMSALPEGFAPAQTRAIPAMGSVFYWNVVSRSHTGGFATFNVSTWKNETTVLTVPRVNLTPAVQRFQSSRTGRLLTRTNRGFLALAEVPGSGNVLATDLRYPSFSAGTTPAFLFRREYAPADSDWVAIPSDRTPARTKRDLLAELKTIWRRAFF